MTPDPFFHSDSGSVRFWVDVNGQSVGASVSQSALHYRFHPRLTDDDPMATYLSHTKELHEAVRRRVASGSIEPVMLREPDL